MLYLFLIDFIIRFFNCFINKKRYEIKILSLYIDFTKIKSSQKEEKYEILKIIYILLIIK